MSYDPYSNNNQSGTPGNSGQPGFGGDANAHNEQGQASSQSSASYGDSWSQNQQSSYSAGYGQASYGQQPTDQAQSGKGTEQQGGAHPYSAQSQQDAQAGYPTSQGSASYGYGQQGQQAQQNYGTEPTQHLNTDQYPSSQGSASYGAGQPAGYDAASQGSASYGAAQPAGYDAASQGSASYAQPASQSSASYAQPGSQGSASYGQPDSQWQPASAPQAYGQGDQATWNAQPGGAQPPAAKANKDDNPIKALTDFSFTKFATPGLVKIVYIMTVAIMALYFVILAVVMGIAAGTTGDGLAGFGVFIGIFLLGAVLTFFVALTTRVQLEFMLALVRNMQDTRRILEHLQEKMQ